MKLTHLALAFGVVCSGAMAEPFSYRYAEISYINQTDRVDGVSGNDKIESDGYSGTVSLDFNRVIFQLNHSDSDVNRVLGVKPKDVGLDVSVKSTGVFVGGHGEPDAKSSFFGGLGFDRVTLDSNAGDANSDVWRMGGGGRYWVIPRVELNAQLFYVHASSNDDDSIDNDIKGGVGIRFQPVNWLSIGANYVRMFDSGSDGYTIDARFQF